MVRRALAALLMCLASGGVADLQSPPATAPQAQALQAVITGVQGGEMPYALYGFGALLGVLLGLGAFPGLGVLVGLSMYLPIKYVLTYGLGCLKHQMISPSAFAAAETISQPRAPAAFALKWTSSAVAASKQK